MGAEPGLGCLLSREHAELWPLGWDLCSTMVVQLRARPAVAELGGALLLLLLLRTLLQH